MNLKADADPDPDATMNEAARPEVSFVIPMYNTGKSLEPLLQAFINLPIAGGYELILVNDASPDGSGARVPELVKGLPYPVTFVDLARNFGEHAAVLEGFRHTRGHYVINLDDDLQNPISEALKLLEHIKKTGADVVYADYGEKKHSWWRNMGSRFTNAGATWLLDKPADLYLCSFRALNRALVERVIAYRGPYPYVDGLIIGGTNRIETLLVDHHERSDGSSGYTLRKLVRLWMNMFFNFSIMPLRLSSLMGALLVAFGILMMAVVVFEHLFARSEARGWASLMAAIAIFSGGQLLMLGVIGEYVGRAFMTVSGKPQSLVRSVKHYTSIPDPEQHSPLY